MMRVRYTRAPGRLPGTADCWVVDGPRLWLFGCVRQVSRCRWIARPRSVSNGTRAPEVREFRSRTNAAKWMLISLGVAQPRPQRAAA